MIRAGSQAGRKAGESVGVPAIVHRICSAYAALFLKSFNVSPRLRKIPLRIVNHRPSRAAVIDNCASWFCICGNLIALQGRSGPLGGPTADTVTTCPSCQRNYFVIPQDRSHGPPVEVVELLALPETEPDLAIATQPR